ncbi:MAG: threonine aldolase family protein [Flavobacteriales bacterium]|jgi:threonine aldolase|tara:strand:+ start:575 stop:1594 length:1020 start_codon:yes stop_codon:yes gene_type:complete
MQIDLRSDTVTKPSNGMIEAMMTAKLGDDVYAEDPSVNALEARVATMFGKPKALFFPSGTMANQTAIKLHTQPGEQLVCDAYSHVYNYEGGGVSFNSGVSCKLVDGHRGMMTAAQVQAAINPPDFYHSPLTSLVSLENTTNKGGGACWDYQEILKIKSVCDSHKLGLHLDGARLWNALISKSETPQQYGDVFDTISVCFSKGLGAPVGSVLVGNENLMNKALRIRKMLGGGMRQVGLLAAAASYALDHQYDRLKEDHQKAKEIAEVLNQLEAVSSVEPVETNIVIFKLSSNNSQDLFLNNLKSHNVLLSDMGGGKLRMVTHLDYTDAMHTNLLEILSKA